MVMMSPMKCPKRGKSKQLEIISVDDLHKLIKCSKSLLVKILKMFKILFLLTSTKPPPQIRYSDLSAVRNVVHFLVELIIWRAGNT